jgi:hypothetical protein
MDVLFEGDGREFHSVAKEVFGKFIDVDQWSSCCHGDRVWTSMFYIVSYPESFL